MGVFRKVKQSLGFHDQHLRERGLPGTAKVLSSTKTSISDDDGDYIYKTELLITRTGAAAYKVAYKVEGGLATGAEYPVFVDPDDPENVFVDHEVDAQEVMGRVSDALSQASATLGVGAAGTATPLPGLTPEMHQMMADNASRALAFVKDPAQRQMLIAQYRAAGITLDDVDT